MKEDEFNRALVNSPELEKHLENIVMEIVMSNLTSEQLAVLKKAEKEGEAAFMEKIQEVSANIPGLAEKIEQAIAHELETLKKAHEALTKDSE